MANYQSLKAAINAVIKANGNKEITGTVLNEVLLAMVNSLGAGYQFAGVATPSTNPGTPDQKVFYIASQAGTYTNFNGAVVSDGIAIFEWNGTWTTETLDLSMAGQVQSDWTETDTTKKSYIKHKPNIPPSANVDPVPTKDSQNAVSSGGTFDMIQDATNVNAIESVDGKIYNDYQAGDIFFIVDNNVRKYRVALVAGTADSEHPVTISPVNFYYALNSADAINLSLTLKTVSTEQQSLNADQQVQAQNNVMGKAYAPAQFSGLGKKVLAKNIEKVSNIDHNYMTKEFFKNGNNLITNTVFVIQYDYELKENVEIGDGCTLEFDGGSIKGNYTITGNNTRIKAERVAIFSNVTIAGTWNVGNIYSEWFSDILQNNNIKKLFALTSANVTNDVYIAAGTYNVSALVNGDRIIVPKDNTNIHLSGTILLATNSFTNYYIVHIDGVNNVTIDGGVIIGDRDTHPAPSSGKSEWGMGINIVDSYNIVVRNITVNKCWGDSIYVGGNTPSKNIIIDNVIIDNSRRQGISATFVENLSINNAVISNIRGTLPEACIDIEPNANEYCRGVKITNCAFYNSTYSLDFYAQNGDITNLECNNIYCENIVVLNHIVGAKLSTFKTLSTISMSESSDVVIDNFDCTNLYLYTNTVSNIRWSNSNINLRYDLKEESTNGVPDIKFDNCDISTMKDVPIRIKDSSNCRITTNGAFYLFGNCSNISVVKKQFDFATTTSNNGYIVKFGLNASCKGLNVKVVSIKDDDTPVSGHIFYYFGFQGNMVEDVTIENDFDINPNYSVDYLYLNNDVTRESIVKNISFVGNSVKLYTPQNQAENKLVRTIFDFMASVGTTRPALAWNMVGTHGFQFFDLTINKAVYYTGNGSLGDNGWVDATGGNPYNQTT